MYHRKSRLKSRQQSELMKLFVAGSTARAAAEIVGVNKNTVADYFMMLRKLIASKTPSYKLSGEVEADESYFGGVRKGKRGRGAAGKVASVAEGRNLSALSFQTEARRFARDFVALERVGIMSEAKEDDFLLTKKEAARRLAVSTRTLDRLVVRGELRKVLIDSCSRFRKSDIDALVAYGS